MRLTRARVTLSCEPLSYLQTQKVRHTHVLRRDVRVWACEHMFHITTLHHAISMDTITTNFPLITTNVYVDICDLDLRVAMTLRPVTATPHRACAKASEWRMIRGKTILALCSCLTKRLIVSCDTLSIIVLKHTFLQCDAVYFSFPLIFAGYCSSYL